MKTEKTAGRLVAIVVTHNRLSQLKTSVERLLDSPDHHVYKVLVVDNASTDGTDTWLAQHPDPRLCHLRVAKNIGGAGGFETGLRYAKEHFDPDWFLLSDDDGRPFPDTIRRFHDTDHATHDAIATAVFYPDGSICDLNRPSRNPFWNIRNFFKTLLGGGREGFHLKPADYQGKTRQYVDGTSFVGFFASRRAVELAGYPDGTLFIYGEDVLYSLTLRIAGGKILFDPTLRYEHDHKTRRADEKRLYPLWKTYYFHRNLLSVYRVAAGAWFWPALLVVLPRWVAKVSHYPGNRREFLTLLGYAIRDGLARDLSRSHDEIVTLAREQVLVKPAQQKAPEKQEEQPEQ